MQFEQGDVVVKGLAVVVVVDVGGRHPEGLGSRTAKLLGQVMVANSNVNCISSSHNAEKRGKMSDCSCWFGLIQNVVLTWLHNAQQ